MTGDAPHPRLEREGPLARIVLDRTDRLNAFGLAAVHHLDRIVAEVAADPDIRVVTMVGEGRAFSTGIDLKELAAGDIDIGYHPVWERALRRLETMEKVVICLLHGHALGGGLQLALAADIRVATPTVRVGLPAINEGLIPGLGTFRLARYVGLGRAKRLILSGETIDGTKAQAIGLVDHLVPEEGMGSAFQAIVDRYAAANSEGARLSKAALLDCFDADFDRFFERYLRLQDQAMNSADFREAMIAYREGRPPRWG